MLCEYDSSNSFFGMFVTSFQGLFGVPPTRTTPSPQYQEKSGYRGEKKKKKKKKEQSKRRMMRKDSNYYYRKKDIIITTIPQQQRSTISTVVVRLLF